MYKENLKVVYVSIKDLKNPEVNPRRWSPEATDQLRESLTRYGCVDPIICNSATNRKNIIIGGNFRTKIMRDLKIEKVPVVYVNIPDIKLERELNLRLNKNTGEFDLKLLAEFDESILANIGFSSEEIDEIFDIDPTPEMFDLEKELKKLSISKITVQKGDIYAIGENQFKLLCGDSTVESDVLKLMESEKADLCLTDPPYQLDYLNAKRHGKPTLGFGSKRNRRYLETDVLPENFTELWMKNISKIQKESFSIIVYENWRNLRNVWGEMEKYWKVKNMIVWHLPNRNQAFASKYKFFSKHDIAMVGASKDKDIEYNLEPEKDGLQEEYETALYAISGKPHWESYKKGKTICPTDFIEFNAADEKSSGQSIVFGVKPLEILIPYVKVLTRRNDLIFEPFGGSGSTAAAALKMKRRCYLIEKSPVYAQIILHRIEQLTGLKAKKISGGQNEVKS